MRAEGSEAGAGADVGVGADMGARAQGGAEDKAKAEGAEDKAAAETELAIEVEAKVEAEARTGAFRLKNIKKMESTTMAGRVKPLLLTACHQPTLLMTWPRDFWPEEFIES